MTTFERNEVNEEQGQVSLEIAASPAAVYDAVTDVTRIGEWSPECRRATWIDGATGPAVGARFLGQNKAGDFEWEVPCEVRRAEPGVVFEYAAAPGDVETLWTWTFEPAGDGTRVTLAFDAPMMNLKGMPSNFAGRDEMLRRGMAKTLERLRDALEGTAG